MTPEKVKDMSNKVYLSGPMSGLPEKNFPAFARVTAILRARGDTVYNPAEFDETGGFNIRRAFAEYSAFICLEADEIVLLPGWENSLGASAELALAKNCGLKVTIWVEAKP